MKAFKYRMNMNLTADHYTAYLLTPKYYREHLNDEELSSVCEHLTTIDDTLVPIVMKYQAKTAPFQTFRFVAGAVDEVHPLSWWKLIPDASINSKFITYITQLMTAVNSSASIERVFSTFGLVHSKIRYRKNWQTSLHI